MNQTQNGLICFCGEGRAEFPFPVLLSHAPSQLLVLIKEFKKLPVILLVIVDLSTQNLSLLQVAMALMTFPVIILSQLRPKVTFGQNVISEMALVFLQFV